MKTYEEMIQLFEKVNNSFLEKNSYLLVTKVSERTLCGNLMNEINNSIMYDKSFDGYVADVEYNRNAGKLKTIAREKKGSPLKIIKINCDLILHSRGKKCDQDNLIAIEMKKSSRSEKSKDEDRKRLIALTKNTFNDVWSFDGKSLPEHVCRYVLGVYYEINYDNMRVLIEYYKEGEKIHSYLIAFDDEWNIV